MSLFHQVARLCGRQLIQGLQPPGGQLVVAALGYRCRIGKGHGACTPVPLACPSRCRLCRRGRGRHRRRSSRRAAIPVPPDERLLLLPKTHRCSTSCFCAATPQQGSRSWALGSQRATVPTRPATSLVWSCGSCLPAIYRTLCWVTWTAVRLALYCTTALTSSDLRSAHRDEKRGRPGLMLPICRVAPIDSCCSAMSTPHGTRVTVCLSM